MHDSWVFCGAEHYPNILENDHRFATGYTCKNKPKTTSGTDICRKTWKRKKKAWLGCRFNFISPSNYEKDSLVVSALFHNAECTVIPNIIPDAVFRPLDKNVVRNLYQIPSNKKIIGFGAAGGINDKKDIKGGYFLLKALEKIKSYDDFYLVVFGDTDNSFVDGVKIPVFTTGFISNPYILAGLYNLCDVFVCPSIIENLPSVCIESLFCCVPVAAFRTGGIPDIVEHIKTGYLAEPFDTDDLYKGILYCIDNYKILSENSMIKAKKYFNNEDIVKKHIDLYKNVLAEANK
jgi:glycosyltransferase involved in cell wall biosynthesis